MTALLVDLGNSRWKMTHTDDLAFSQVVSGSYKEMDDLGAVLRSVAQPIDSIWLASVVDDRTTEAFSEILRHSLERSVRRVVSTDSMPDLISGYRKRDQLGIDRLMAMVAARAQTRAPFCVVDAGTAVTIDFVDAEGGHLGGFILPGQRMFRRCLLDNTSIPRDEDVDEHAVLGRDTATAVALAGRYAVTGIVGQVLAGPRSLFPNEQTTTFVGGGDAEEFLGLLSPPCHKLDHLVLRGLAVMAAGGGC